MAARVTVVGSINMDLVVSTERLPSPGETILGTDFQRFGGGKGAMGAAMKAVHFDFNGSDCTWYGFWFGFGLAVSIFLLLSAFVAWQLDKVEDKHWPSVSSIAWALAASHAANAVLAFKYFFAGPTVIGTLATLLIGFGAWRRGSRAGARAAA